MSRNFLRDVSAATRTEKELYYFHFIPYLWIDPGTWPEEKRENLILHVEAFTAQLRKHPKGSFQVSNLMYEVILVPDKVGKGNCGHSGYVLPFTTIHMGKPVLQSLLSVDKEALAGSPLFGRHGHEYHKEINIALAQEQLNFGGGQADENGNGAGSD